MLTITRVKDFEAAHFLPNYEGKCRRLHGHSYHVEVTISGNINTEVGNPREGMIMDFHDIDNLLEKVFDAYDHHVINDFLDGVPTAERIVCDLASKISKALPKEIFLEKVRLWETRDSYATWEREKW